MVAKTISAEDECQKGDTAKALMFSDTPRQVKSNEINSLFNKLIPPHQKRTSLHGAIQIKVTTKKQDIKKQMEGIVSKETMLVNWMSSDTGNLVIK